MMQGIHQHSIIAMTTMRMFQAASSWVTAAPIDADDVRIMFIGVILFGAVDDQP